LLTARLLVNASARIDRAELPVQRKRTFITRLIRASAATSRAGFRLLRWNTAGALLSVAGLLVARQDGRFIYYAPDFEEMAALVSYLTENCCGGETCAPVCKPVARKRKEKVT